MAQNALRAALSQRHKLYKSLGEPLLWQTESTDMKHNYRYFSCIEVLFNTFVFIHFNISKRVLPGAHYWFYTVKVGQDQNQKHEHARFGENELIPFLNCFYAHSTGNHFISYNGRCKPRVLIGLRLKYRQDIRMTSRVEDIKNENNVYSIR